MPFKRLLVASRGETAVHLARVAVEPGLPSVAVHGGYDGTSLHLHKADDAVAPSGSDRFIDTW